MIISRTPFRISFFGGGTDYPAWFREHGGGGVLATAIDKYCYLSCRYLPPFFDHRTRIVYSKIEVCQAIEEIEHPAVREVLRYRGVERGVELHYDADLPARSGMGSSSAFTVGLLHAVYALQGLAPAPKQLASDSIHLERDVLKEDVGTQDQILAAYGGFNHIVMRPNDDFSVAPVRLPPERMHELGAHLMLFFTGVKRTASSVARTYLRDLERKAPQLTAMGEMVTEARAILSSGEDITRFGKLLDESWRAKRSLSDQVSNPHVEALYDAALAGGAIGGKLTGAGGGGFLLLFAEPTAHARIRERLRTLVYVPFGFEPAGTRIVYRGEEPDYAALDRARAGQPIEAFRELEPGES